MARNFDIAEVAMTDGLTPLACEKINRNFRRLVALCTTETQGTTVYNSLGSRPSGGSSGDAAEARRLAERALSLANQALDLIADIDDFVGATSSADGEHGLVPAPQAAAPIDGDVRHLGSDAEWDPAMTSAQTAAMLRL